MSLHTTARASLRRRLALATLVPVLGLTAACGGGDAAESGTSSESSEASQEPYDEKTIIPAMQEALDDASSAQMQMELTGQVQMTMEGQVALAEEFADGEMELTIDVQGQTIDMRLVDGLIYVSGPPATPAGKWLEVDPQDPQDPLAQQFSGLAQSGDLKTTFDAFKEGLREVKHQGEEEIDGEPVDHYVFTVDTAEAMTAQGQPMPPGAPKEITYDVFLNEDDLMRRVAFELGPVKAEVNATDWGEPVEVEAPAKSDVVQPPPA